jgi:hypothetical protein
MTTAIERQRAKLEAIPSAQLTFAPMLKTQWVVEIPKGGEFQIHYKKDLSWWVRFWLQFIGWGVKKPCGDS